MPNGMHGYDNTHKDMQALFVASGPNVKKDPTLSDVDTPFLNLEVYKFICDLLDIVPNPNNSTSSQAELLESWRI
jgi:hypothetical protein